MKGYSFRSLTDLVLKIFKTKVNAGTGLSGGGSLEADRTLTVKYGTAAGTAAQGNDSRLSNSREWTGETISQAEAEAGTVTTRRAFSAQRVRQAIVAWWNSVTGVFGRDLVTSADNSVARTKLGLHTSAVRWPAWAEVTSKPTTFAPSSHTHPWAQVTGQPVTATRWPTFDEVSGKIAQATRWPTFAEVTGKPANYPTTWDSVAAKPAQATRWPTFAEVTNKPIVQTVGKSTTDLMSQKAVTDLFGQPYITGACTTNGTTNSLTLTNIVTALGLEKGDVIQITGSVSGLNDKLFTVDGISNNNSVTVNYVHAENHGNGSLKLVNQSTSIIVKRVAKWYNAPLGLGQAWINMTGKRSTGFSHGNITGRSIMVMVSTSGMDAGDMVLYSGEILLGRTKSGGGAGGSISGVILAGQNYAVAAPGADPHWVELC